jgi:hypothetical protein
MNNKKLFAAATLGLMLGACATNDSSSTASGTTAKAAPLGECHGINACKGKSDCSTKTSGCHGTNACKGKGWTKMTKEDCTAKKGTFKEGPKAK